MLPREYRAQDETYLDTLASQYTTIQYCTYLVRFGAVQFTVLGLVKTDLTPKKNNCPLLQLLVSKVFGENFGWARFLVVCFLHKTNPNP